MHVDVEKNIYKNDSEIACNSVKTRVSGCCH